MIFAETDSREPSCLILFVSGTGSGDAGSSGLDPGSGGAAGGATAVEVTPSVDVNPCSVLADSDVAELGLTQFRRSGAAVGFDASSLDFFPRCEWTVSGGIPECWRQAGQQYPAALGRSSHPEAGSRQVTLA